MRPFRTHFSRRPRIESRFQIGLADVAVLVEQGIGLHYAADLARIGQAAIAIGLSVPARERPGRNNRVRRQFLSRADNTEDE